jgi:iron complex outermembrane receptor protein
VSYYNEKADQVSDTQTYTDSVDTLGMNLGLYEANGIPFPLYGFTSSNIEPFGLTMLGMPWREAMYNRGDFKAYAAFGDVIWHVSDKTNLTVGLRYTQDKKEFTWINGPHETPELDAVVAGLEQAGFFTQFPVPPEAYRFADIAFQGDTPVGGVTRGNSWDDVSPRVVLDYKVTPTSCGSARSPRATRPAASAASVLGIRKRRRLELRDWRQERIPECGRGAEYLHVLLRLQEQAGARWSRHRGSSSAVPSTPATNRPGA